MCSGIPFPCVLEYCGFCLILYFLHHILEFLVLTPPRFVFFFLINSTPAKFVV